MMKTNRRLLALGLAVLLLSACFTGCSSQSSALKETGSGITQTEEKEETGSGDPLETTEAPQGDMVTIWVLAKEIAYREDGTLYKVSEFNYDENGLQTGASSYRADGTFIRDEPSYTYTIDGNTITRSTYDEEDGHKLDYTGYFTFDENGRVTQMITKYESNGRCSDYWRFYYDENGNLSRTDDHLDTNGEITDEPCWSKQYVKDENGRIVSWKVGNSDEARVTWDENGRVATYAVYDKSSGKLRTNHVYGYEYQAIEVPAEYADAAQAIGMFLIFFTR